MRGYRIVRNEMAEIVAPPDGGIYILGKELKLKVWSLLRHALRIMARDRNHIDLSLCQTPQQILDSEAGPETKPADEIKAVPEAPPKATDAPASISEEKQRPSGSTAAAGKNGR